MAIKKNLFIAFEGIDGSGKSTQIQLLADRLTQEGHKVYTTFEPTDNRIGQIIRDIMSGKMEADNRTIAGLFVADRLHHLLNNENGILKMLRNGYTVLTDRYLLSSYAYQGTYAPMNWVIQANSQSAEILRPHLNIYLDIHPAESMKRIIKGRESKELYEKKEILHKVRNKYFEAIELLKHEEVIYVADANRPGREVAFQIWQTISNDLLQ